MLEEQTLLLGPWAAGGRAVVAPATGRPLGVVRRQRAARPWWLRWLAGPVLAVHEADDEPLLFTVRRAWGLGRREVCDADGRLVGRLRGDRLLDR
ncbi:MAG TPA: hypothetical protein VFA26_14220, partial [Gemmataceae bacterium]|nr:hypothetical protein [Gemmataceae bacterium]